MPKRPLNPVGRKLVLNKQTVRLLTDSASDYDRATLYTDDPDLADYTRCC
jgi:hypothetical protein